MQICQPDHDSRSRAMSTGKRQAVECEMDEIKYRAKVDMEKV